MAAMLAAAWIIAVCAVISFSGWLLMCQ